MAINPNCEYTQTIICKVNAPIVYVYCIIGVVKISDDVPTPLVTPPFPNCFLIDPHLVGRRCMTAQKCASFIRINIGMRLFFSSVGKHFVGNLHQVVYNIYCGFCNSQSLCKDTYVRITTSINTLSKNPQIL